jgi:hypothetical protein
MRLLLPLICCCCWLLIDVSAWVPHMPAESQLLRTRTSSAPRPAFTSWRAQFSDRQEKKMDLETSSSTALRSSSSSTSTSTSTSTSSYEVDVAIIGGGPAGSVMAALLAQQHKLKVVLLDPKMDDRWIPNYGVWLEEWQGR